MGRAQSYDLTHRRVVAWLLIGGSLLALVTNVLHPRIDDAFDTAAFLEAALWTPWRALHAVMALAILAVVAGLLLSARFFGDEVGGLLHKLGSVFAAVGGLMFVFLLGAVDGVGYAELAQRWAAAPTAERDALVAASVALEHVNWGLIATATYLLFGFGMVFYGWAILAGEVLPRALGFLGLAAGLTGCIGGAVFVAAGPTTGTTGPALIIINTVGTLFVVALGLHLLQTTGAAAGPAPGGGRTSSLP